jgi:hypothetical protein
MNKSIKSILILSLAVLAALAAGLATGLVAGALSNRVYLVFLYPLGVGLAAGFILEKAIGLAKIRNARGALALGCLMALAVYGAYQWINYATFRGQFLYEMHQQILEETGRSELIVANVMVDYALQQETGFAGFPGYLLFAARQGVTVGKSFGPGLNLGPFFTWVFWLLEWGIIGWATVWKARRAAGRPFCETCRRWYGKEHHLGGVSAARAEVLTQLLERRDFARAGLLLEADAEMPSLEVYSESCGTCSSSDTWLALKQVSLGQNGKLNFKPGAQVSIRPHERAGLLGALKPAAESAGPDARGPQHPITVRS